MRLQNINLIEINAQWGGEAAAKLCTNYLSPRKLSLFINGENKKWMSALKLIPSNGQGEIDVLNYFWNKNHPIFASVEKLPNAMPPIYQLTKYQII